jgi:hypothetical protein
VLVAATWLGMPAAASERELDNDSAPSSAGDILTPITRTFPVESQRASLFPWLTEPLRELPAFFADSRVEIRFRTYYLRQDRVDGLLSEAWAMGGSFYYRSGWLANLFQTEVEAFTSQPIIAPGSRGDTLLLEPDQDGYSVLGIANGKLRYGGLLLTGYRQYLHLPYANRQDNRMTPNTFESVTLQKPEGTLRFVTGYSWKVKLRDSDKFRSFPKALGIDKERGLAHLGVLWLPSDAIQLGSTAGAIPDILTTSYTELNINHAFSERVTGRLDAQFTYRDDIGDDLLGDRLDQAWNVGFRTAGSYAGLMVRLGMSITGGDGGITSFYGTNPSYAELMQRSFTAKDEKAVGASLSYDFAGVGVDGLTAIANFVAAFDGERDGVRQDAQEFDLTVDYQIGRGWLSNFWFRVRASWLHAAKAEQDSTDVRVILRYDLPVI